MLSTKLVAQPAGLLCRAAAPAARNVRRRVAVRAEAPKTEDAAPAPTEGTVFYGGAAYNDGEWKEATTTGAYRAPAPVAADEVDAVPLGLGDIMAFSGPAPELINGRLAMLAFVAALGAELASNESVVRQLADEPTGVVLTAIIFISASLIPLLSTTKREAFGPFSPEAEMLNGRAAMIGVAALLIIEAVKGSALF